MSGFSNTFGEKAQTLKQRIALSEVFAYYGVSLSTSGSEHKGLCPFHADSRPSLNVNDAKGVYLCRACGATGDHINLAAHFEQADNGPALDALCQAFAPDLYRPYEHHRTPSSSDERDTVSEGYAVLAAAARYFQDNLAASPSEHHLTERGFTQDTIERFGIGHAPARYHLTRAIQTHLDPEWASELTLEAIEQRAIECGLLRHAPEKGERAWPLLRNRLVFPIHDGQGRVCGFAGRALSDHQNAKYLNTPDSEWFHKSQSVFAGPPPVNAGDYALLVEGYTDVMALHQAGISAIATMGTAFNSNHARAVTRWHRGSLALGLDPDDGGRGALPGVIEALAGVIADGRNLALVQWPERQDPADLLSSGGCQAITQHLANPDTWSDALEMALDRAIEAIIRDHHGFARRAEAERQAQWWLDRMGSSAPITAQLMADRLRSAASGADPGARETLTQTDALLQPLLKRWYDAPETIGSHFASLDPDLMERVNPDFVIRTLADQPWRMDRSLALLLSLALIHRAGRWPEPPHDSQWWSLAGELQNQGLAGWMSTFWYRLAHQPSIKKPEGEPSGLDQQPIPKLVRLALTQYQLRPLWTEAAGDG